jgi:hypothetical protein
MRTRLVVSMAFVVACSSETRRIPAQLGGPQIVLPGVGVGGPMPDAGRDGSVPGLDLASGLENAKVCVVSAQDVFVTDRRPAEEGVYRVPLAGGTLSLAHTLTGASELALGASLFALAAGGTPKTAVALGATTEVLGGNESNPASLFASETNAFWLEGEGSAGGTSNLRQARAGQAARTVSSLLGGYGAHRIAADSQYVYVALNTASGGGTVFRTSLTSPGLAEQVAMLDEVPRAMVASSAGVLIALASRIVLLDGANGAVRTFAAPVVVPDGLPLRIVGNRLLVPSASAVSAYSLGAGVLDAGSAPTVVFEAPSLVDICTYANGFVALHAGVLTRVPL